jgi:hypothetical protein
VPPEIGKLPEFSPVILFGGVWLAFNDEFFTLQLAKHWRLSGMCEMPFFILGDEAVVHLQQALESTTIT